MDGFNVLNTIAGAPSIIFNLMQLIGGIILSVGYVPQIVQLVRTKAARDLNLASLFNVFLGVSLMEFYAVNLAISGPGGMFLLTNTMSLLLSFTVFILAKRYKK